MKCCFALLIPLSLAVPPSFPPGPSQLILSRGAGGTELEAEDPLAVEKERWRQQHKHAGQSRDTTKATRGHDS